MKEDNLSNHLSSMDFMKKKIISNNKFSFLFLVIYSTTCIFIKVFFAVLS